jgi:hypothetical protein
MKANHVASVLFVLFSLVLIACGGGSPGDPGGTTGDCPVIIGPVTSIRIEAVKEGTSTVVDPTNIFINEQIRFRITGIDTGAVGQPRINLCAKNFSLTGTPGGTFNTDGLYIAPSIATGSLSTVQVTYNSVTYTSALGVVVPDAILTGRVRLSTGSGAPRIGINCYNAAGAIVAAGFTGADGTIRMSTPPSAVKFSTDFSAVDPESKFYVRQFTYNAKSYSTVIVGCIAPLPVLATGNTTNLLSDVIVFASSGSNPPPPPDGCR